MELRQQELPDEHEWDAARHRAKEVFGLGDFDTALLTAANVAVLAGKLQSLADGHREAARRLTREVRISLARMGVSDSDIAQAPRWRTAQSAEALVSGLVGKGATDALKHLARTKLETSAAAVGTSLTKATEVYDALNQPSQWETFDAVALIHGEDQSEAEKLLATLKGALFSDEYALALGPHLEAALTHAIRLLRPKKFPITPTPTPTSSPPPGWKVLKQGNDQITRDTWEDQVAKLKALLGEGDVRLDIHWTLQRKGPN